MPALQAILFDLDGTLIDSLADLAGAINRMLVEHGYPARDLEVFPEYIGDGVRQLVWRALPEHARTEEVIDACLRDYQRHYESGWHDQTVVYEGMMETLTELKARGLKLGCISNKPHRFTTLCCDYFFPAGTFEIVLGQRDEVPRKPHPAGALEAAAALGVDVTRCAYVGDSGIDMSFAKNAGMFGIGVSWGFRSVQELNAHGAQVIVHQPRELAALPAMQIA
jgi:phosphoglycolate phosphatase